MARVMLLANASESTLALRSVLLDAGYELTQVPPVPESASQPADTAPDLILVRQAVRQGGDRLIRHLKANETLRYSPILVVTENSSAEDNLAALEVGADDYMPWPTPPGEFLARLQAMLRIRNLYNELRQTGSDAQLLRDQLRSRYTFENILGTSYAMRRVFELISKVTGTSTTVIITGESGTGKELVARAIHYNSARRQNNFVIQNCSVFNDNLLESELFGHVRGSFTGAVADKQGLFEVADAGTLFLDEVGDMSPALQVKVLRVLQEGTFVPVGSTKPRHVDVRVISATNRPLEDLVKEAAFRQDLYYRLNVFRIDIPPLRDRRDDIPLLAQHFLETYCAENSLALKTFAPEVLDAFTAYPWPGNVRELENEVERLVVMARDEHHVTFEHLSTRIREAAPNRVSTRGRRIEGKLSDAIQDLERAMIAEGLNRNGGNKSLTARELGISRANLVAKVKKYGLGRPSRAEQPQPSA